MLYCLRVSEVIGVENDDDRNIGDEDTWSEGCDLEDIEPD
jgi:hypothetical protein